MFTLQLIMIISLVADSYTLINNNYQVESLDKGCYKLLFSEI